LAAGYAVLCTVEVVVGNAWQTLQGQKDALQAEVYCHFVVPEAENEPESAAEDEP
jgi:hypothetical protein